MPARWGGDVATYRENEPKLKGDGFKKLKKRIERAWEHKRLWIPILDEVYRYVLPYRDSLHRPATGGGTHHSQPGAPRTDFVFDATAVAGSMRFAGRIQSDVTPTETPFFELKAGPLIPKDERKQLDERLEVVSEITHAVLSTGNFHTASHEA